MLRYAVLCWHQEKNASVSLSDDSWWELVTSKTYLWQQDIEIAAGMLALVAAKIQHDK